jgi:hypothetical protein
MCKKFTNNRPDHGLPIREHGSCALWPSAMDDADADARSSGPRQSATNTRTLPLT